MNFPGGSINVLRTDTNFPGGLFEIKTQSAYDGNCAPE